MNDEIGNNGEEVFTIPDWAAEAWAENWQRSCRDHLHNSYPDDKEVVEEYIGEAEHQDGIAYWFMFQSMEAVETDFTTYMDERGPVEGDLDKKGDRVFSSHKAALPYLSIKWSTFQLKVSMHHPDRMHLLTILRDDDGTDFRIDGDIIHEFKLNTWKEVAKVANQLWRISGRLK
jgi:hypothetical protein